MTATVDQVSQMLDSRTKEQGDQAESRYRLIVHRMAEGGEIDLEAAAIELHTLGKSPADVRRDAAKQTPRIDEVRHLRGLADAVGGHAAALHRMESFNRETERIVAERRAESKRLFDVYNQAEAVLHRCNSLDARCRETDQPAIREEADRLRGELLPIAERLTAARESLDTATAKLADATYPGVAKKHLAEHDAAVAAAEQEATAAESDLTEWNRQWSELLERRLLEPDHREPAPAQVPRFPMF